MPDPKFEFQMKKTVYSPNDAVPDTFNFKRTGEEALADNFQAVRDLTSSMRLKEQTDGVVSNVYGVGFTEKLTDKERTSARKKSGSELYIKDQNKKLMDGAPKEYLRRLDEFAKGIRKAKGVTVPEEQQYDFDEVTILLGMKKPKEGVEIWKNYVSPGESRYTALDRLVELFVNQDFEFDLSTEAVIAAQSLRFIQLKYRADAFLSLISKNLGYWSRVNDTTKAMVMKKLQQSESLWKFYTAKESLITDDYYSSHLDSEMSYTNAINDNESIHLRNKKVIAKLQEADMAYESLLHMEDADKEAVVANKMDERLDKQFFLENTAVPKGKEVKSKGSGFEILDVFGLPLKIASFFMRDKRKADHGRSRYEKMARDFDKKFPKYLCNIGTGDKGFYRGQKGNDLAPEVHLGPLFSDPVKTSIAQILNENKGIIKGADKKDEVETFELYRNFIDVAERYIKIGGIVNADTTEMEMAFLDRMKQIEELFGDKYDDDKNVSEISRRRALAVKQVMNLTRDELMGNLKNVTKNSIYKSAVENSTAVIQSTTITGNMDESNIRDIPLFTHYPNINDVKQSTIGDCYLVGAMTSFVKASPQGVLDMFQDLGDGDVLVRLYEGYDNNGKRLDTSRKWIQATVSGEVDMKPVFVKVRKHYETGDGNANDCVWTQLLEKAYAASGFNMKGVARVDEKGYLYDMEKELTAGMGFIALSHLTGSIQRRSMASLYNDQQNRYLKKEAGKFLGSGAFMHRLGAGVPNYIMKSTHEMIYPMARNMSLDDFLISMESRIEKFTFEYGTELLKIRDNFVSAGLGKDVYAPIIEQIAEGIGLKLSDDWQDKEAQELFDIEFIKNQYFGKVRENYNNIIEGKNVTFDTEKALDTDNFSNKKMSDLLGTVEKLTRHDKDTNLEGILPDITSTINTMLGITDDGSLKAGYINEHRVKEDEFWSKKENVAIARKHARRMQFNDHEHIKENLLEFLIVLKEAVDKGGSVEISINHFISALDMKQHNNQWFILIKDPFNIYNMSYDRDEKNNPKNQEEGFLDVLDLEGHKKKRHLDPDGDIGRSIEGGFRGLSWWKLEDLAKKMRDYTPVLPGDVKHTVM